MLIPLGRAAASLGPLPITSQAQCTCREAFPFIDGITDDLLGRAAKYPHCVGRLKVFSTRYRFSGLLDLKVLSDPLNETLSRLISQSLNWVNSSQWFIQEICEGVTFVQSWLIT